MSNFAEEFWLSVFVIRDLSLGVVIDTPTKNNKCGVEVYCSQVAWLESQKSELDGKMEASYASTAKIGHELTEISVSAPSFKRNKKATEDLACLSDEWEEIREEIWKLFVLATWGPDCVISRLIYNCILFLQLFIRTILISFIDLAELRMPVLNLRTCSCLLRYVRILSLGIEYSTFWDFIVLNFELAQTIFSLLGMMSHDVSCTKFPPIGFAKIFLFNDTAHLESRWFSTRVLHSHNLWCDQLLELISS